MRKREKISESEKYRFKKYDPRYPKLFQLEKSRLTRILPKDVKIAHIGSTAVAGLGGKGIIDIIIGAEKKSFPLIKKKLISTGYIFKPNTGNVNRLFFQKDYTYSGKTRRVHVHLVPKKGKEWDWPLKTLEILRKNKKLLREYAELKKKANKIFKGEGKGKKYREYKRKFLDKLENMN